MTVFVASGALFRLALGGCVHHCVVQTGRATRALSRHGRAVAELVQQTRHKDVGSDVQNCSTKIEIIPDKATSLL